VLNQLTLLNFKSRLRSFSICFQS